MANIEINKKKIQIEKDQKSQTILETMDFFLNQAEHKGKVVTKVTLDGDIVDEEREEQLLSTPLTQWQDISFSFQHPSELAQDALNHSDHYLETIIGQINDIVETFRLNKVDQAEKKFSETLELIDLYIQLMSNVIHTLKVKSDSTSELFQSIQTTEGHLLSVLQSVLKAQEDQDFVMLCDLLEYELIDNLNQWKENIVPQLTKIVTS